MYMYCHLQMGKRKQKKNIYITYELICTCIVIYKWAKEENKRSSLARQTAWWDL